MEEARRVNFIQLSLCFLPPKINISFGKAHIKCFIGYFGISELTLNIRPIILYVVLFGAAQISTYIQIRDVQTAYYFSASIDTNLTLRVLPYLYCNVLKKYLPKGYVYVWKQCGISV